MTVEELHDEIEAINAIYPQCCTEVADQIYSFVIPNYDKLSIQLSFPPTYPDNIPDLIQLVSTDSTTYTDLNYIEQQFRHCLQSMFMKGIVCVFELLSECENYLQLYDLEHNTSQNHSKPPSDERSTPTDPQASLSSLEIDREHNLPKPSKLSSGIEQHTIDYTAGWIQSQPIVDRGSTFIGFARKCTSVVEAKEYIQTLTSDRKIARATHNITSWRIQQPGGIQFQDCDDDGETAAGGRLLHLLTVCIFTSSLKN
jgi:hypothetical protein